MMERGSPFLKSKWEGEQAVREAFPEATIIRPAQIYGKKDRYCLPLASRMRRIYGEYVLLIKYFYQANFDLNCASSHSYIDVPACYPCTDEDSKLRNNQFGVEM